MTLNLGKLTAFLLYNMRFYARLDSMSRMVAASQRAAVSARRVFEILDRVPSVAEPARPVQTGQLQGQIELRNIGFKYGTRTVLKDVSLTIQAGEMIGLVGTERLGQEHAGQPRLPVLRRLGRIDPGRRHRYPLVRHQ